jgi:hypothetical protein
MRGGKRFIEVVKPDGAVKERALTDLTQWEEELVFGENGAVRTVEEQREYLEQRTARKKDTEDWKVDGQKLIVRRATVFTKDELEEILEGMK